MIAHFAYLAFQMLGGLLGFRDSRWLLLHGMAVAWGVLIVAMQWSCPATVAERWLRTKADGEAYTGSFLDHYVFGTYLPNGSQALVYGLHLLVIGVVYLLLLRRWGVARSPRGARSEEPGSVVSRGLAP